MVVAVDVQVVRWRDRAGGRWLSGEWSGERGADGSLSVVQATSGKLRSLRPERVEVRGRGPRGAMTWSPVVVATVDDTVASWSRGSSRDGVRPTCRNCQRTMVRDRPGAAFYCPAAPACSGLVVPAGGVDPLAWVLRELVAFASVMRWSGHQEPFVGTASGSELAAALEAAYAAVRREFPKPGGFPGESELPDVVIITGSGLSGYGLTWGHFAPDRWRDALASGRRPELFIGGERLSTGALLTMQTLLHECAHVLAFVRGVKDTSRQHRYHNREFVRIANELGLDYVPDSPDSSIGFSAVTLTSDGRRRWSSVIADLHAAITLSMDNPYASLMGLLGRGGGAGGHGVAVRRPKGTGGTSYVKLTCADGFIIRTSRSTADATSITCGTCGEEFTET